MEFETQNFNSGQESGEPSCMYNCGLGCFTYCLATGGSGTFVVGIGGFAVIALIS